VTGKAERDLGFFRICTLTPFFHFSGDVRIEGDEVSRIAGFLILSEQQFLDQFTRLRTNWQGLSLIEKENRECIMPRTMQWLSNKWNLPGWRQVCEANPTSVVKDETLGASSADEKGNHLERN
jgi:hypothetical protein